MTQTQEVGRTCTGYFKMTGLTSAKTIPGEGNAVMLQAETQSVRIRLDGVAPDGDTGMLLTAGTIFWYVGDLSKIQVIEDAATAVLHVHTFKGVVAS